MPVKQFLKSAQKAMIAKEYTEVLECCKAALKEDSKCYEAYLFVGKAAFFLKETEQALEAYQRAIDLNKSALPAWQGMAELCNEAGQWSKAAAAYKQLYELTSKSTDEATKAKVLPFLRKQAEAHARGTLVEDVHWAEASWRLLLDVSNPGKAERLELLCRLADSQLKADRLELEARVQKRLAEAEAERKATVGDGIVRKAVEAEWAEEALECMESDNTCDTLREILSQVPPSPPYVAYYDAYLRRLRKYVHAAPPSSMERHSRRVAVIQFSQSMIEGRQMEGRAGAEAGFGCCSPFPYESALQMLEVEGEQHTCPSGLLGCSPTSPGITTTTATTAAAFARGGNANDRISLKLAHSFPWNPSARVHRLLALRRRTAAGAHASSSSHGITVIGGPKEAVSRKQLLPQPTRSKILVKELLSGLHDGVSSAAGWLAAADLQLEKAMAGVVASDAWDRALYAAKQGLTYVAHRDFLGKERMYQATLLLKMCAGRALIGLGDLDAAETLLSSLVSSGVSEGFATFAEMAGMVPVDIGQQSTRYLAQVAMRRGQMAHARWLYEGLVGREAMGRCAHRVEPWTHAEYGALVLMEGEIEVARQQLESALAVQLDQSVTSLTPTEAALAKLRLAQAYWALGGELRTARGKYAQANLLAAAAETGPHQAETFTWLGKWYSEVAGDSARAIKCFQRALGLDPTLEQAGNSVVELLVSSGDTPAAIALCQDMTSKSTKAQWACCKLAMLQLSSGSFEACLPSFQHAIRRQAALKGSTTNINSTADSNNSSISISSVSASLWEGMAAAYQRLGRHQAALKSYTKALALQPDRFFSLIQSGALHYQAASFSDAVKCYEAALEVEPSNPVALLGAAETRLASAHGAASMGSFGLAASDLDAAVGLSERCARQHGNLQSAWKLLGDVQLQHATVTPLRGMRQLAQAAGGRPAAEAAVAAIRDRLEAVRQSRRAYCKALHLGPTQGLVWGDLASAVHKEACLASSHPAVSQPGSKDLLPLAQRLVCGGLRLEPSSDWLWSCAGNVASPENPARAEYCWSRSLQLNPKRAATWARLGRMYARYGAGSEASGCFDQARSFEPTLVSVWESMGYLAGAHSKVAGGPAYNDMLDSYEHAVGLGGGLESRLAYAADALLRSGGGGDDGAVAGRALWEDGTVGGRAYSCASKCVAQLPLLPSAHLALGLAAEARGDLASACEKVDTALALLLMEAESAQGGEGSGQATWVAAADKCQVACSPVEATRLHLSRLLAKRAAECHAAGAGLDAAVAASEQVRLLEGSEVLQATPSAWLAAAAAMKLMGKLPEAEEYLERGLAVATAAAAAPASSSHASQPSPLLIQLRCALALMRFLLEVRKLDAAQRLVATQCERCACKGPAAAAPIHWDVCVDMWAALVAGAAVQTGSSSGGGSDFAAVAAAARAWAVSLLVDGYLGGHKLLAIIESISSSLAAARGQGKHAVRAAAQAVHLCPWDASIRLGLASAAGAATSEYASATCKVLRDTSDYLGAAVADGAALELMGADVRLLRACSLLHMHATSGVRAKLMQEMKVLTRLLHCEPSNVVAAYLLALLHVAHAAASGGQCVLYRRALLACKLAIGMTHARMQERPDPLLSNMYLRLMCAISECLLYSRQASCAQLAAGAAAAALRWSTEHGGCCDQSLAHRQLARVHAASQDRASMGHAASLAAEAGGCSAVLELSDLRLADIQVLAGSGPQSSLAPDLSILPHLWLASSKCLAGGDAAAVSMLGALTLTEELVKAEQGVLEGVKELVAAKVAELPLASQSAAYALQALVALRQLDGAGDGSAGDEASRKLALEARWASSTALRLLAVTGACTDTCTGAGAGTGTGAGSSTRSGAPRGPRTGTGTGARNGTGSDTGSGTGRGVISGAVSSSATQASYWLLLARAELQRGRADKAVEALQQVSKFWPEPFPPPSVSLKLADLLQHAPTKTSAAPPEKNSAWQKRRVLLSQTVHAHPGCEAAWKVLGEAERKSVDLSSAYED